LKPKTFIQSISAVQLQQYVGARLSEVRKGGRPVAAETVRKEVATFRIVWNWGVRQRILESTAPIAGLVYPKRDEKPPFMTWTEIERTITRNKLPAHAAKRLWEDTWPMRFRIVRRRERPIVRPSWCTRCAPFVHQAGVEGRA
jgi:hypothetical protein